MMTALHRTATRRPRRDDVRRDVLSAAKDLFLARGYERTTIDEVADRAGYTKGAVYSNFGGKPELFAEVCRERFADEGAQVVTELGGVLGSASPAEVASQLADALVQVVLKSDWQVVLADFRALAHRDPRLAELYAEVAREREDAMARELDREPIAGTSERWRQGVAFIVLMLLNSLALEHRARPDEVGPVKVKQTLTLALEALLSEVER